MVALSLSDCLRAVGLVVLGPAPSVDKALAIIESGADIDVAIVDANLGGVLAYPVADALVARKIPFVFSTGYRGDVLGPRYPQIQNCSKPYDLENMIDALAAAVSRRTDSTPSK